MPNKIRYSSRLLNSSMKKINREFRLSEVDWGNRESLFRMHQNCLTELLRKLNKILMEIKLSSNSWLGNKLKFLNTYHKTCRCSINCQQGCSLVMHILDKTALKCKNSIEMIKKRQCLYNLLDKKLKKEDWVKIHNQSLKSKLINSSQQQTEFI